MIVFMIVVMVFMVVVMVFMVMIMFMLMFVVVVMFVGVVVVVTRALVPGSVQVRVTTMQNLNLDEVEDQTAAGNDEHGLSYDNVFWFMNQSVNSLVE